MPEICAKCGEQIKGKYSVVDDKKYHPECFTCDDCKAPLMGAFFKREEGGIICKPCLEKEMGGSEGAGRGICRKCGEKIAVEDKMVIADGDDVFHEGCFVCFGCDKPLVEYMIDEDRNYHCKGCAENLQKAKCPPCKAVEMKWPPCVACKKPCDPSDTTLGESLQLLDGSSLHWNCFKCSGCGKTESPSGDTSVMKLLRSKVQAVKAGRYQCDDCTRAAQPAAPAEEAASTAALKAAAATGPSLPFGSYFGKIAAATSGDSYGNDKRFMITLSKDGVASFDSSTTTTLGTHSWHADGCYAEGRGEDRKVKTVKFIVEKCSGGPEKGTEFIFDVADGQTHKTLVHDGITCALQVGLPAFELKQLMNPPAPPPIASANSGYTQATPPVASVDPATLSTMSLADLKNESVWRPQGVDPSAREQRLEDGEFAKLFGCSKDAFSAMPKWKRDKAKKEHGLF